MAALTAGCQLSKAEKIKGRNSALDLCPGTWTYGIGPVSRDVDVRHWACVQGRGGGVKVLLVWCDTPRGKTFSSEDLSQDEEKDLWDDGGDV